MKNITINRSIDENNFVGIKYDRNKINFYLPLGMEFDVQEIDGLEISKDLKLQLVMFLKSISLVKSKDNGKVDKGIAIGESSEVPFNSFFWIISDYLKNDLYQEIDKKYIKNGNGKINWKRTLNSDKILTDTEVVYLNPYYESRFQKNNIITELNNYCLHISYEYIGFLFGNISLPITNLKEREIAKKSKYYINVINKELSNTFNDRKKLLLRHMKRILDMTFDDNSDNQKNYGTNKYEYVWEKMVNDVFGSKSLDISKYFPEAYWTLLGKSREKDKSKLRPDSIYKTEDKLYILDAKYYRYGVTGRTNDLPHTDSIQKQITYGDHISTNKNLYDNINPNNIFNAFILPFNKDNNNLEIDEDINYYGFAESAWKKSNNNVSYEKIALILVDTKYLINCFYQKEKSNIEKMISSIELINSK